MERSGEFETKWNAIGGFNQRQPLYRTVAKEISNRLRTLKVGDELPSEAMLSEQLGVSRATVREALRELETEGRIVRRHGKGTIVAKPNAMTTALSTLESMEELALREGWKCGTKSVVLKRVKAPKLLAVEMGVETRSVIVFLSRIKTRDGIPFSKMLTWMPAGALVKKLPRNFRGSIVELLSLDRSITASAQVSAAVADGKLAMELRVKRGAPLVVILERIFGQSNELLALSRNYFVPDAVRLEVARRREMPREALG